MRDSVHLVEKNITVIWSFCIFIRKSKLQVTEAKKNTKIIWCIFVIPILLKLKDLPFSERLCVLKNTQIVNEVYFDTTNDQISITQNLFNTLNHCTFYHLVLYPKSQRIICFIKIENVRNSCQQMFKSGLIVRKRRKDVYFCKCIYLTKKLFKKLKKENKCYNCI